MQDVQVQNNLKLESIPLGEKPEHIQEDRVSLP